MGASAGAKGTNWISLVKVTDGTLTNAMSFCNTRLIHLGCTTWLVVITTVWVGSEVKGLWAPRMTWVWVALETFPVILDARWPWKYKPVDTMGSCQNNSGGNQGTPTKSGVINDKGCLIWDRVARSYGTTNNPATGHQRFIADRRGVQYVDRFNIERVNLIPKYTFQFVRKLFYNLRSPKLGKPGS